MLNTFALTNYVGAKVSNKEPPHITYFYTGAGTGFHSGVGGHAHGLNEKFYRGIDFH